MPSQEQAGRNGFQMKDVIHWHYQEALHYGEIGLSCNSSDACAGITQATLEPVEPVDEHDLYKACIEQSMDEQLEESTFAKRRHHMETTLKPLVARTELEMIKKLMGLGCKKSDLGGKSLRQLVVDWTNLTRPQAKDYIEVWVDAGSTTDLKEMIPVRR